MSEAPKAKPRRPKKVTFAEAMAELLSQNGKVCAICDHPERADIEAMHRKGAPAVQIGKALQRSGAIDPNITAATAGKRVLVHMDAHAEKVKP